MARNLTLENLGTLPRLIDLSSDEDVDVVSKEIVISPVQRTYVIVEQNT